MISFQLIVQKKLLDYRLRMTTYEFKTRGARGASYMDAYDDHYDHGGKYNDDDEVRWSTCGQLQYTKTANIRTIEFEYMQMLKKLLIFCQLPDVIGRYRIDCSVCICERE